MLINISLCHESFLTVNGLNMLYISCESTIFFTMKLIKYKTYVIKIAKYVKLKYSNYNVLHLC